MHDVVVYSRKDCCLCGVLKQTLQDAAGAAEFQWSEVDIDADPELRETYNEQVPVVFIDGRKAFKFHMEREAFLQALARR